MTSRVSADGIESWLGRQGPWIVSAWTIAAAFSTYFCMYAFRKPFTAGTYDDTTFAGLQFKTVLVIAQVLGYTLSKFIGIKVISEITAGARARAIVMLILIAELALVAFAFVPPPWNFVFLFLNGLPLGMVFGLVLAYLEGRRLTEALTAGLCASFIVSSGVVKSVGRWLVLDWDVSEYWMPALTGILFAAPLGVSVWMLTKIPPPTEQDVSLRAVRAPITRAERWDFFIRYAVGLTLLLAVYIALTVVRSIRDDFAVEIWIQLGVSQQPSIFAQTETLVMFSVVLLNAAAVLVAHNRTALLGSFGVLAVGFALVGGVTLAHGNGWLDPFAFMVLSGIGLYVPYVAFHTTVFERLIAATRDKANLGFLMYLADSVGYLAYIGVMVARTWSPPRENLLEFFRGTSLLVSAGSVAAVLAAAWYFARRIPVAEAAAAPAGNR